MAQSEEINKKPCNRLSVLITRFSLLGDVAMTVPVLYSACAAYPDAEFVVVTQQVASTIFVNAPVNLRVEGIDHHVAYKGVGSMHRLAEYLVKKYSPDVMIDLQGDLRSWWLCVCMRLRGVGKVLRIHMGNKGKRALTRRHDKRMLPLISSRARYREVFFRLGMPFENTFTSVFGDAKASPELYSSISAPKQPGERWIAVAPFAKWDGKIYPMELMQKVLLAISQWQGVKIFLLGQGDAERAQFAKWVALMPNAVSLAERRNGFPAELALLSHCDVMLTMDNMNMHLASMVRLRCVSVWGATHPYCGFMGWQQSEDDVVQLNMACRPCSLFGDKPCYLRDNFCLRGIQPSMVVAAVERALQGK
ncbi:MAG: glycosyltransferase family 9 protein [Muribaculaceae bacterium]